MKSVIRLLLTSYVFLSLFLLTSCSQPNAEDIVNKAIAYHGGDLYEKSIINFDFRDRHYILERDEGIYRYNRIFQDSLGEYHDVLNNDGFSRSINGQEVPVTPEWARKYSNSINSVAYFTLLPFGLNDAAVNKTYLGLETIKGQKYHKIRVTFDKKGGGEDHEDVFLFWFHESTFSMDYLAYSYHTDGEGIRFREAVNQRVVGGLRFADYNNFTVEKEDWAMDSLAMKYEAGKLKKLSEINLENVDVKRMD